MTLRLTNRKDKTTTFVLEPYGDFWPMEAGATYELHLEIHGDEEHHLPEVAVEENSITVHAGVAGHISVWQGGREINSSSFAPPPLQRAA